MELSEAEKAAFKGLNDSYVEMTKELEKSAPKCHFMPMFLDHCDFEYWWECSVCGHTKSISTN